MRGIYLGQVFLAVVLCALTALLRQTIRALQLQLSLKQVAMLGDVRCALAATFNVATERTRDVVARS